MSSEYNVANSYKEYKKQLDSYINPSDSVLMSGCNRHLNQHISNSKYGASNTCEIVVRFLSHLKEKNHTFYQEDGCKYLYYWLHVEALDRKVSIENTLNIYKELNEIFNSENDGFNIFDKYLNELNKHTCEKIPKIIHLYKEFNKFESEQTTQSSEKKCTSSCFELFDSYIHECRESYDYDFCKKLKIFREQYNFFIRRVLECEGEEYILPPVENFDAIRTIFTAFGPWIRHLVSKKGNIYDNINQETHQLLHPYEMGENNNNRDYNIAYSSS
ncbi:hypothetical protein POWCR01_000102800 [Plasmodium ovale]|uniref:PIR protein n=1 Tax=Plasmodium ovale TaxID=36330 RepID=A0A1C3KHT3_PLAOA|nr:hypothetical protein POWCR01_000102800 [Plasmodium ovale]